MTPDHVNHSIPGERYPVNPFDLSTDLFCTFSSQVIHLVMHLDGHVRYDLLERAVERASLLEPITRCRIIREEDTLFWQELPACSRTDHVLRLSSRGQEDLLYQALCYPLDPYRGELFQVILIEDGVNGDVLVINAHHIVMDGRGLRDFTGLVMKCYAEFQSGTLTEIPQSAIWSRQLPRVSSLRRDERETTQETPTGWCSPLSVPLQSSHADTFRYSLLFLNQSRTAVIGDTRREWGITVNDLMIAVLARAIAHIIPVKSEVTVPLYITIDLRRYLPVIPERSLVNFSTSFEVKIPLIPDESLEDTGKRVHLLMNRIKSGSPGLDEAVEAEKLAESGYTAARDLMVTAWKNMQDAGCKTTLFSNTGIISRDQMSPGILSVRNAYLLPGFFQPPGFFFLLSTFGEIMTLSASYAIPAYDPEMVDRMLRYIDSIIPGTGAYPGEYRVIRKET
ncbi:MAG: condensation domain-containing protein [Methanospirillum sp.]|nr:condensation domain-containing protein [Methanospirillum sp.]